MTNDAQYRSTEQALYEQEQREAIDAMTDAERAALLAEPDPPRPDNDGLPF